MDTITQLLKSLSKSYNNGTETTDQVQRLATVCLQKLATDAKLLPQGQVDGRVYSVFAAGNARSRPVRDTLTVHDHSVFEKQWMELVKSANAKSTKFSCTADLFNQTVYTALNGFACTFDLFKPGSRKTPGTFFEIIVGSLFRLILPGYERTKHIPLIRDATAPEPAETLLAKASADVATGEDDEAPSSSVATDVVFSNPKTAVALVLPVKTTTRERIVQPFAHQRILDSYFSGHSKTYKSVLIAVNEVQRDEDRAVKSICVPGTIRLFQQHLAKLTALCYLDPPARYLQPDLTSVISVKTLGDFVTTDALKDVLSDAKS